MGGVGIEPTQQRRHQIYSLARLSYSGAPPPIRECRAARPSRIERIGLTDLEFGVLRSSQRDPVSSLDLPGRNEPAASITDHDEDVIRPARSNSFTTPVQL